MSIWSLVRGIVRFGLAAAIVAGGHGLASGGAEAKSIKVKSTDSASSTPAASPQTRGEESSAATSETDKEETTRAASPRRRAAAPRPKDIEVPGCPAGMLCSVCLAGCVKAPGSILHAQPRTMTLTN